MLEKLLPKVPTRVAVALIAAPGNQTKYSDLLREIRTVKPIEMGISDIRCRKAITGGVVEIPGKERVTRAEDDLATKLRKCFRIEMM